MFEDFKGGDQTESLASKVAHVEPGCERVLCVFVAPKEVVSTITH
jgi:hypothetical protein